MASMVYPTAGNSKVVTRISIHSNLHYPLDTTPTWYNQCQRRGSGVKALITSRAISLGKLKRVVHLVVAKQRAVHLLGWQNVYIYSMKLYTKKIWDWSSLQAEKTGRTGIWLLLLSLCIIKGTSACTLVLCPDALHKERLVLQHNINCFEQRFDLHKSLNAEKVICS